MLTVAGLAGFLRERRGCLFLAMAPLLGAGAFALAGGPGVLAFALAFPAAFAASRALAGPARPGAPAPERDEVIQEIPRIQRPAPPLLRRARRPPPR